MCRRNSSILLCFWPWYNIPNNLQSQWFGVQLIKNDLTCRYNRCIHLSKFVLAAGMQSVDHGILHAEHFFLRINLLSVSGTLTWIIATTWWDVLVLQKPPTKGQSSANHSPEPGLTGAPKALTPTVSTQRLDLTSKTSVRCSTMVSPLITAEPQTLFLFLVLRCGPIHFFYHFMIGTRVLTTQR